ncbi:MAG: chemotaxis-specific protein-glutamate methyltransferase CheB [Sulfuricurvum sp.]|uniref:chemotaxis-specific protein-glutamate methyltransferase CheB n=1 Tax=Sulfuricurvum sp. TaxID=2025608 RepID=UPI0025FDC4BB|nr:chemotaxis-specific protein-glutamate methyltransferase CheB [Sulfuricurvum sp.]MBV5322014.1 chemotaxis-specific protein-glutamate methyltransferase CheB [Sulfuricurvum sp.]
MYRVIVIDDSPLMQRILSDTISRLEDFEVVATASDAFEARDLIKQHEPDMVTVDINMPKMDGVAFLRNLMRLHPMPAVVISTDASRHQEVFDDGAVGFIAKKGIGESDESFFKRVEDTLLRLTFLIDRYQSKRRPKNAVIEIETVKNHPDQLLAFKAPLMQGPKVIAIGASTGGVETLMEIFSNLTPPLPPILITLHIPFGFSGSFAERLDRISSLSVYEAQDGQAVEESSVYIAPGNRHMLLENRQGKYFIKLLDGPRISRHKPSVDILLRSVHNASGSNAMGIMLTGMGDDGSIGMKEMFNAGAYTVAQSQKRCVVYGMPAKAIEAGAIKDVIDLNNIPSTIQKFISYRKN